MCKLCSLLTSFFLDLVVTCAVVKLVAVRPNLDVRVRVNNVKDRGTGSLPLSLAPPPYLCPDKRKA